MNTYRHHTRFLLFATTCAALLVGISPAQAQFGGGRRGGFGGGMWGPPNLAELRRESVQKELKLTDEQIASIGEVSQDLAAGFQEIFDLSSRVRRAESDEAREAAQAELTAFREKREADVRTKLEKILDEAQLGRLDQIVLHRTGPSAMARDEVAEKLGLSENQKIAIADMVAKRQEALQGGGFRMRREERDAIGEQWDTTILGTLEATQLAAWTEMLGDPPPEDEVPQFPIPGQAPAGAVSEAPASESDGQVVSSFESRDGNSEKMSFNFQDAPWEYVLQEFADRDDLKLDLIDTPPGTFDYTRTESYTPVEVLDILNGYLLQRGYILIRRDDFLVSIRIDSNEGESPVPPHLIPYVSASQLYEYGRNELLTVVFSPIRVDKISDLAEQVEEMLGPLGKAVGIEAAHALAVTDLGTNLRRVDEVLKALSVMQDPGTPTFKAYTLQHIAAKDAEELLRPLLGLGVGVQNVSAGAGSSGGREDRDDRRSPWSSWGRGRDGDDNSRSPFGRGGSNNNNNTTSTSSDLAAKTQLTVNARTNQLLVAATEPTHNFIEKALEEIDREADEQFVARKSDEPYLEVYRLTDADATEVTKSLSVLMPDVVINEDGRNRLIHIWATAEQHRQVAQWIRQLDGLGGGMIVAVIPLAAKDPVTAASELKRMFIGDSNAPIIEPNLAGRQLMVRGTTDQLDQIKLLLAGMGEDGKGQRLGGTESLIRRVSLSGRNAERLLDLIQQAWSSTQDNHIQIIPPQERTSIYDLRLPDAWTRPESTEEPESPETTQVPPDGRTTLNARPADRAQARFVAFVNDETVAPAAPESESDSSVPGEPAADQPQSQGAPSEEVPVNPDTALPAEDGKPSDIYIRVEGDNLIITGDDPEALNALENLLQDALAYVPPEGTWKVYPLKSADAFETAEMLKLLIQDTTVSQTDSTSSSSSLSGMLGRFGSSVMDATGMDSAVASPGTLTIIPEPNLNALFVTGPTAKISELEQFLDILDASDWPESYRDRYPRLIPVKYAEVSRVYQIVSDVFSDYLQTGQNNLARGGRGGDRGNNGGGNPFAAMFAGNNRQAGPEETKLTLGVDEQTSNLIVSADESLYLQIKGLVEQLDAEALAARRTVQVVTLQNTNSSVLQSTLQSLMPRVQVTTSGNRPGASQPQSPGGDNNGGPNPDQIRQMFEQRMRDRMQQQQSGDSNGGGRPSFGGFRGFGGDRGGDSGGRPSFGGFGGFRGFGGRGFGGDRGGFGGGRGGDRGGR